MPVFKQHCEDAAVRRLMCVDDPRSAANRYCSVTKAIVGMTLRYRGGYPGGKTK